MKSPQMNLNSARVRRGRIRETLPAPHRAATLAMFALILLASVVMADMGLTLARELPALHAQADATRGW